MQKNITFIFQIFSNGRVKMILLSLPHYFFPCKVSVDFGVCMSRPISKLHNFNIYVFVMTIKDNEMGKALSAYKNMKKYKN